MYETVGRIIMARLIVMICMSLLSCSVSAKSIVIGFANNVGFWTYPQIQKYLTSSRTTEVTLKQYQSGCELLHAMQNGEVDLAYADVPLLYQIQLQSLPFEPLATAVTRAENDQGRVTYTSLLVTATSSSIASVRGAEGKTLGVVPWTLSGQAIPQMLFQQVGLLPTQTNRTMNRYRQVSYPSFDAAKAALKAGEVDVVGYPAVYRLNTQKYGVIAALNDIPNPSIVVNTPQKNSSSVQDVLALLSNIPKQDQYPGLGNTMRFASVQSTPYTFWVKQISQSGLFTTKACPSLEDNETKEDKTRQQPSLDGSPEEKTTNETITST
ncbi:MAG: hypothetical protein CL816_08195 [Coxiellaceae bacterium]|nr:hypothetical protein [Coxiellaceae bacterium]